MPLAYNIRVMFARIIRITHSDRALFNLNALVLSLGTIVPAACGLRHYCLSGLHSGFKSNSAVSLCVAIILSAYSNFSISMM